MSHAHISKPMIEELLKKAASAAKTIQHVPDDAVSRVLLVLADAIVANADYLIKANAVDLEHLAPSDYRYDRLRLDLVRLKSIAADIRNVSALQSPVGELMEQRTLPNGLDLRKVRTAFGLVGVIYEARPNVTFDVFSICFKSGNACILKGGSDAEHSNRASVSLIRSILAENGLDENMVTLLPSDRSATAELLSAKGVVDLIIPRGSRQLIDYVTANSKVPVIETGAGVCHCYIDAAAELEKAKRIVRNAKTRRVSVCNALDCMIVHESRLVDLPELCRPLAEAGVGIYADSRAYSALNGQYPSAQLHIAADNDFGKEFLSLNMSIKTVDTETEAIEHIGRYGTGHSESIVSEDNDAVEIFFRAVDAACVYANAPTSFTDGAQFGLGAEIGISTQKMHARGPMALRELTTYKWLITGNGQIRD